MNYEGVWIEEAFWAVGAEVQGRRERSEAAVPRLRELLVRGERDEYVKVLEVCAVGLGEFRLDVALVRWYVGDRERGQRVRLGGQAGQEELQGWLRACGVATGPRRVGPLGCALGRGVSAAPARPAGQSRSCQSQR